MGSSETGVEDASLVRIKTGVYIEHVCAKLCSDGCHEVDVNQSIGPGDYKFRGFKKMINGKFVFFTIPDAMGPEGYEAWELMFIEAILSRFGLDLYPIDLHLH